MTFAATSQTAEEPSSETSPSVPRVKVLITHVHGADLDAALATIERQVYENVGPVEVVGEVDVELPEPVTLRSSLLDGISSAESDIDYIWLIHSDARPRPDALSALVSEVERNDASLGGSKVLVAGTPDVLESIGSATDVFGEPYSGLDEGEIDLQQYDVVREVALVSSVSMLVRRDLAQGLGGLDELLRPGAAGLDFSQRVRLAGGRVIIVPSSEVYHQGRCGPRRGWRELAGRYRAMLKAYRLVTLAWVIPFGLIVGLVDSIASLLILRWRPAARYVAATAWNLVYLPSTIAERRRFRRVRGVGDEELFRFQARGSIRLRAVGSEFSDRLLFMFDDDHALVRGTRRVWASPGIWGALAAIVLVAFSERSLYFNGIPNAGFNFPFEAPSVALDRFFGGWNESGLGSAAAVHPSVGLTGLLSLLWFGREDSARTLLTLGFGVLAVVGMGRLMGRAGIRGPGRYLAGLVLLAGPGTALASGAGSWLAVGGAAVLPWAIRALLVPKGTRGQRLWGVLGWATLLGLILGSLTPALVVVPFSFALLWVATGGRWGRWWMPLVPLVGLLAAAAFVIGDPGWIIDAGRRQGFAIDTIWPALVLAGAAPMIWMPGPTKRLASIGAVFSLSGILVVNLGVAGPGVEEAALVLASFGAALVVAAALDRVARSPLRVVAVLSSFGLLVLSVGALADGRLGLLPGDDNARYAFASTLADEGGPGRILVISENHEAIPGQPRAGSGYWYRTIDGSGSTLDEIWLPPPSEGDRVLELAVAQIASGAELRPGELLSEFAIDWVVVTEGPAFLDGVLAAQLDLVPTPLDPTSKVYENPTAVPLATDGFEVWERSGDGFVGETTSERVRISTTFNRGWMPAPGPAEWAVTVSGESGSAQYRALGLNRYLPLAAAVLLGAAMAAIVFGRARR